MKKGHAHVLGDRDTWAAAGAAGKSAEFALATEGFLDPQPGLALLICRARRRTHGTTRTSRTSRDAYAKRDNAKTSNSELEFPVGEPSVLHPQPPITVSVLRRALRGEPFGEPRLGPSPSDLLGRCLCANIRFVNRGTMLNY